MMFTTRSKGRLSLGREDQTRSRIYMLMVVIFFIFALIILRLFQLQVVRHEMYTLAAKDQHMGKVELPAKRGDIYVKDTHSGELSKLATNTTLDLLYVDPNVDFDEKKEKMTVQENRENIAGKLTPILFTKSDYEVCKQAPKECFYDITVDESLTKDKKNQEEDGDDDITPEEEDLKHYEFKDYQEILKDIESKVLDDISQEKVDFVVLKREVSDKEIVDVAERNLPGIFVNKDAFLVYADPTLIPSKRLAPTASTIAEILELSESEVLTKLSPRDLRYVLLKNKLTPQASQKIKKAIDQFNLKGVVLIPEHWRFYPEGSLAANVTGFINRENLGQYGIEGQFNVELEGKKGSITAESDPNGRQITVGDAEIVHAVDGDDIVLTIDRVVQKKIEEILAEKVEEYRADSGQVVVMNPYTGAIVAMANYPTYDPNDYAASLTLTHLTQKEVDEAYKTTPLFKKDERNKYVNLEDGDREDASIQKYGYKNRLGDGVFKNKIISEQYEPGSSFKPIVMAMALDANEVEPETTFNDNHNFKVGPYTISNSDGKLHGITTMTQVLELSLNTGMMTVAQKLGPKLMYEYMKNFGLGEKTNVELEGEVDTELPSYIKWNKTQMLNMSFGQGIVVTPIQLITAWAALANGGKLMQPYIVDSVIKDGKTIQTEPKVIHRVISEEASNMITSMLISVVKRGHGKPAAVPGHLIAGKTGTAQIAAKGGGYEKGGVGTTVTTFAGYFPAFKPQFVMLVKFDRPRSLGENTWGATTSAPTFGEIAKFLIDYYNIEPDA